MKDQIYTFIFYFAMYFFSSDGRGNVLSALGFHGALTTGFNDLRTFSKASLYIYMTFYVWVLQILYVRVSAH